MARMRAEIAALRSAKATLGNVVNFYHNFQERAHENFNSAKRKAHPEGLGTHGAPRLVVVPLFAKFGSKSDGLLAKALTIPRTRNFCLLVCKRFHGLLLFS